MSRGRGRDGVWVYWNGEVSVVRGKEWVCKCESVEECVVKEEKPEGEMECRSVEGRDRQRSVSMGGKSVV